jgi:uncharacterized protein YhfF
MSKISSSTTSTAASHDKHRDTSHSASAPAADGTGDGARDAAVSAAAPAPAGSADESVAPLPPLGELVAALRELGYELPPGPVRADGYGDTPALSRELLDLIRYGDKRGGTSLLWGMQVRGETVPAVGDIEIVIDHLGQPALVTRVTRVEVLPFENVGAEFAASEGDGDRSLASWRRDHWAYFSRECAQIGRVPTLTMPCVCSNFELLHVVPPGR